MNLARQPSNPSARASLSCGCATLLALIVAGCPAYGPEDCTSAREICEPNATCDLRTGMCVTVHRDIRGRSCSAPEDCQRGETCSSEGQCQDGSCALHGCVAGYRCQLADGGHVCDAD